MLGVQEPFGRKATDTLYDLSFEDALMRSQKVP